MKQPYHTALKSGMQEHEHRSWPKIQEFSADDCVAFQHDLSEGARPEYADCDVLYTETAWIAGQPTFNSRANSETTWEAYMQGLSTLIESSEAPAYIVSGTRSVGHLPKPDHIVTIRLNGDLVSLLIYRAEAIGMRTEMDLLVHLAQKHDCIGDPSCGYGRAGLVFLEFGKRYVMSDYNPRCIGAVRMRHENLVAELRQR